MNHKPTGVLLINLGTPDSPQPKDVYRYLIEFLTDGRVIDLPWLQRQLLVRALIVPKRYRQSAKSYQEIWTSEGSPLLVYGKKVKHKLQDELGKNFLVELAMRYQNPSLESGLEKLLKQGIEHLVILPLFPQYASASTGSVFQKVFEILKNKQTLPKLTLINSFPDHSKMIEAFCHVAQKHPLGTYDHYVFSFHGLPQRQILKADSSDCCLKKQNCCQIIDTNKNCYSSQCHQTYRALVSRLNLPKEKTSLTFQSRLGKEPWLEPFTPAVLEKLARMHKKRVLVFCPSFVCDCLETIFEIGIEYAAEFKKHGGDQLDLVQGLNDEPLWIEALKALIQENIQSVEKKPQEKIC